MGIINQIIRMELNYIKDIPQGGFNFDNCLRNKALLEGDPKAKHSLTYTKTGTTICGCVFKDGVVLAADCDHVTEMIKRELELHRMNTRTESRVSMAANRLVDHVFRYGGAIGTYLIIGGYDVGGP